MTIYRRFAAIALLALASLALIPAQAAPIGPHKGQQAPAFQSKTLEGKTVTLAELLKQGHELLFFWSVHCPFCHAMVPDLKEIHKKYQGKGLTLAAVNVGFEAPAEVDAYVLEHDLNYLVLNDDMQKENIATSYQLMGTPTVQLLTPNGITIYREHFLPRDLDALLGK